MNTPTVKCRRTLWVTRGQVQVCPTWARAMMASATHQEQVRRTELRVRCTFRSELHLVVELEVQAHSERARHQEQVRRTWVWAGASHWVSRTIQALYN